MFADTETVTINPYLPSFGIMSVQVTDKVTGNVYIWTESSVGHGSWNNSPLITPGTGNLEVTVLVISNVAYAATATVTITPSSGTAQSWSSTIQGFTELPSNTLSFTMPSAALTLTIAVTP